MANMSTYRAHARAVLVLGLPLIGSSLAQIALHATDTVMLGRYAVEALAAVTLGASSFFILFILGSGFAIGVMPLVAAAAASDDPTEARRVTRMGFWLSALYALCTLPVFWHSGAIFRAMGETAEISDSAQAYLRITGWGMLPALFTMVLRSFLSALERTRVLLAASLAGVALNALADWAFIFGRLGAPELGLRGAAIATLATQVLTFTLLATYAARRPDLRSFQLFVRLWRADWPAFVRVFRLGLPIGLTGVAEGGLFNASAVMMGWIGTMELAAHGVALELASLTFTVHLGLSNAATVRAGQAFGRGDHAGLRDGAGVAIALSFLLAVIFTLLFVAIPGPLLRLFLNPGDPLAPEIVAFGTRLLAAAALFQLADAMQVMALGLLRGIQDTQRPLLIAALSYWGLGVPASYLLAFPAGFGGLGLWSGLVIGLSCAAVLMMARFWRRA